MKLLKNLFGLLAVLAIVAACSEDDTEDQALVLDAGILSGGPYDFVIDGVPDMVSGITLDDSTLSGDI